MNIKNICLLLFIGFITASIAQNSKSMIWHKGTIESLLKKAKKEHTLVMLYICKNSNEELCKKTYKELFRDQITGLGNPMTNPVINFYDKYLIAAKFNISEIREFWKENNFSKYPLFLWIDGDGDIVKSHVGYLDRGDFESLSEETFLAYQQRKYVIDGNCHVIYMWENYKKLKKDNGCKDVLCSYDLLHKIFVNMPNRYKHLMIDKLKYNLGYFDSIELQWLVEQDDLEEYIEKDRLMYTFYKSLLMSYVKSSGDKELKNKPAFSSFSNKVDYDILGRYTTAFKKYLVKKLEDF